ncbi:MAG: tetratricopeptide repeat protein [Armatimonadetes bacterium]|nr:tetratricopeptide repeat protein [Armatimonadota bacterium]
MRSSYRLWSLALLTALWGCGGGTPSSKTALSPTPPAPKAPAETLQASIDPLSDIKGNQGTGQPEEKKARTFEEAQKEVEKALRANPNSYSLEMGTARFYMNAGRFAEAIPHLQKATRLTDRVFPWIGLGDAATLGGKFDLAKQAFQRALQLDPGNSRVMRGIGQLYIAQERFDEAQKYLEGAVKQYPQNSKLRVALGNLYIVENKAIKAIEALEPVVKAEPMNAEAHSLLGEAYARNLHLEAAIKEYELVTKLDPKDPVAYGRIGLYHVNLARYVQAREPLMKAIEIDPMDAHYYWALGDSWLLESPDDLHFDKASQLYRQALNLSPNNAKALYSFAMGLSRHGKPEQLKEAIIYFDRLIKINPSDMNAHFKIAEAHRMLGHTEEARKYQAKFRVLFDKGRAQNRELYRRASFKDTPTVYMTLAKRAMDSKKYDIAIKYYESALQRDETLTEAKRGILEAQNRSGMLNGGKKP